MEDVVLHYQPASAAGLSSLIERTEMLLEPFPCRTPVVFTPWFPTTTVDSRLPIRPAKPAPVITYSGDLFFSDSRPHAPTAAAESNKGKEPEDGANVARTLPVKSRDAVCISETSNRLLPASPCIKPERRITGLSCGKWQQNDKDAFVSTDCPMKRSWSIFTYRGVLLQNSQSLSRQFHHMVSTHRLHLRQRAKWVISEDNCEGARGIEQVWRTLSRSVQSARLPTCNANIQRERAEIWVFCDVLYSEQSINERWASVRDDTWPSCVFAAPPWTPLLARIDSVKIRRLICRLPRCGLYLC
ncbi:hypothetical protein Q5P01_015425 [Channa striata]|uniref:Uncharacterized protein n=1 Tax=Channa striata TaxID=64152 RepID=A0AA88MKF2_CHASR|nr:hypothetical protein Q5P01_015425 [Channa striata]